MEFSTYNPIINLGGLFVIFLFVILQAITLLVLKITLSNKKPQIQKEGGEERTRKQRFKKKLMQLYQILKKTLFWKIPLVVVKESIF